MTSRFENDWSEMTGNPRFLDRLNAVCSVLLALILAAMIYLTLQSRLDVRPARGELDATIKSVESIPAQATTDQAATTPDADPGSVS